MEPDILTLGGAGAAARRVLARVGGLPGGGGGWRVGAAVGPGHREDAGRRAGAPVRRQAAPQAVSLHATLKALGDVL